MKKTRKIIHISEIYVLLIAVVLANKGNIKSVESVMSNSLINVNNDSEINFNEIKIDTKNIVAPPMTWHTEYIEDEYLKNDSSISNEIDSQVIKTEKLQNDILKDSISVNIVREEENTNRIFTYDELKDSIYRISQEYGIPFDIMTTIGHQESGGQWNTNGVESYTGDYGQYQINLRWNLESINQDLGFTKDDLQYNPYKSIEAAAYLLNKLMKLYGYTIDNYDPKEIFGAYNGWINWKDKEMAVTYAESCMSILEQNLYPCEDVKVKTK